MVKAGEASGALDTILVQLADYTEKQVRLKNKIFSAMAYPVIMACIGTLMVVGLFIFVIPKITAIFRDMKAGLPLPTKILIGVSDAVVGYWYVIIIVGVLIGYILKRYLSTETGQYRFHRYQLTIPIFGRLVRLLNVTRFASTLSTLLSSGVPLLTALGIVKNIMVNVILQDVIKESMVDVKEGVNLADALRKGKEFPPLVIHMIAVGEKTGNLENMLKIIAKNYEDQVDTTITALTSILEPLLIAVMGLTVGFVVISIMLPLMNMQSLVR
jgi:general secretion pathway protein F